MTNLHAVDERSAVYLGYDVNCFLQKAGFSNPNDKGFTLFTSNGVPILGRIVPGEKPHALHAQHLLWVGEPVASA